MKTLYEKRRTLNFKCNIDSPINILLEKLAVEEEKINGEQSSLEKEKEKSEKNETLKKEKFERFDKNYQYRIISSNVNFLFKINLKKSLHNFYLFLNRDISGN